MSEFNSPDRKVSVSFGGIATAVLLLLLMASCDPYRAWIECGAVGVQAACDGLAKARAKP